MAFSSELAKVVSDQLTRFMTLNRHQLAGQVANLDFWLAQVRNCLQVIDDYPQRFERLKAAQDRHVAEHATKDFPLDDSWDGTLSEACSPRRVPHGELHEARKALCEATYQFLLRCYREGLIRESVVRDECRKLDVSVAAADLDRAG